MKNSISIKAFFIVLTMLYTNHILAQANNNIPSVVTNSFAAKYPKAVAKSWKANSNQFTAKAEEGHLKYYATFDANGKWINTTTKVNWPWHLPPAIKSAFKNSKYGSWDIYTVRTVESPSGQFYQIIVDDRNHPIDAFHQEQMTENRLVEFKADGEFVKDRDIAVNEIR
jgi:hypothetical protein